ncbi:conserved Plasmodium protein, unknown function [Plasmodium sp. gorilla clade G2]|uniref:conserved Plasmodium protein, unknown function n=1 Tax=Plasmodium sp. gorilla clade G2 TaxID=880535 RepID=UPI000D21CF38|nr:conserved Plasmodium protein, unknown function [Plasmodium sp. gorilla clade G2]SOV15951.1 conserved Plasmodium protein, unknown function [Plasmodium sp. gorilla clade G2]
MKSQNLDLIKNINFDKNHNFINYTELYKKYKEKYNVKSFNKLPVSAYTYPRYSKITNFDELKTELICEKEINENEEEYDENDEQDNINNYDGNIEILFPRINQKEKQDIKIEKKEDNIYKSKKKSLRQRIYDGEVMFYDDYIEQLAVKDYEHFFKKPYEIKRKDEGGKNYFYGKKLEMNEEEDIYRKFYGFDDEYFLNKFKLKDKFAEKEKNMEEKQKKRNEEKILERQCGKKLTYEDRQFIFNIIEENQLQDNSIYKYYMKNKCIFDKNLPEFKKKELLCGYIPDIILPANVRKVKHPKNCGVPLSSLHIYAQFIHELFKCPYIYNAIDVELGKYWKTNDNELLNIMKSEKIKKGYKKDIYTATKEQLEKSSEKLKNLLKNDEVQGDTKKKFTINFKMPKKEKTNIVVSKGRYII